MKPTSVLAFFVLPLLAAVQAQSPILSTSFTTYETILSGRIETTITSGVVTTITPSSQQPTATPGSGSSNNSSISGSPGGNNTSGVNGTSSQPSSTSQSPLPTAPTSGVVAGGSAGADGGAPAPGQTGAGGIYGPDDGYYNAVMGLNANILLGSIIGAVAGGLLVVA